VELTVDRLHEGAVDLLFNKKNWNSADSERRQGRVPRRGTLDRSTGFFLTRGLELRTHIRVFDPTGSLPADMSGSLEGTVPFGLWGAADGSQLRLLFSGRDDQPRAETLGLEPTEHNPAKVASGTVLVYNADDDTVRVPEEEEAPFS
jgi:hypothetical protein